jgi:hypothetical protein
MVRDLPPHLPLFNIPELEAPKELTPVANLIYEDKILENLPGLFALRHVNQAAAKERIIKAQEFAYTYLCRAKLRQPFELMWVILKKPRILEVILLLENLFEEIRILHDYEEIKALAPKPKVLASIGKKLSNLREEA